MDEKWENRLNDEEYKNWLKVSQALIHTKEALHDFTREVIGKIHDDILQKTASSRCDGACKTNKGKVPSCASCTNWVKEIKSYNKGLLNWKNTEPTKWHDVPWEIAKCFMNAQGSKATAAQNTGPKKTDVSGIFNVLANCKEFGKYLKERRKAESVREIRNKVMHSPTMSFSEDEMKSHLNCMITLLEDELHLKKLEACKMKVRVLESLRDGEFQICPEVEINCLEGALESLELLLESGCEMQEESHEVAREFFNAFSRLTKNHKDLERRTDKKFTRMADHFETRMASMDFSHGELKGKVEWLDKRLSELEKGTKIHTTAGATLPTDVGHHDKSLYKNSLQCYAQKKKLSIPKYSHKQTELGTFISTVSVADRELKSEEPETTKKEADQRAAEMALRVLTNEASDENKDCDSDPPTSETPAALLKGQEEKSISYKNKLQEIAQERKIVFPSYETEKTENDLFLSKVFFDGVWYTPAGTEQARKKQDAEQKAAELVLAYLTCKETSARKSASSPPQSKDDSSLKIGKLVCENGRSSTDNAGSQPLSSPSIGSTNDAANSPDSKKSFISKLNEYAQQQGQGTCAVYKEIDCTSGFRMKVTIRDMTFEGEVQSSKKEAKEMAAKEAWNGLNVQAGSPKISPSSPDSDDSFLVSTPNCGSAVGKDSVTKCSSANAGKEYSPITNGTSESDYISDRNPSTEIVQPCESDGYKTYRTKLNEYHQSIGSDKLPSYEDIRCDSGFRCKVMVLDKIFEGTSPQKSKKEAKEQAARQAYLSLGLEQNSGNDVSLESLETSKKNTHAGQADVVQDETFVHDGMPISEKAIVRDTTIAAADSKDKEVVITQKENQPEKSTTNFKGKLLEHANQSKITPMYVVKSVDETKEFVSKVFLQKRCFKGEKASKRKEAEQNAAKIALKELQGGDDRGLSVNCEALLKIYHENVEAKGDFPKYKADADGCGYVAMATVVKKWKVSLDAPRAKKKDAEEGLAEEAIKLLKSETKFVQAAGTSNCRTRLNQFCQLQKDAPGPNYDVVSHEQTSFSGDLYFYTVEEYESLSPQLSKDEAITSAARSACNGLDLI